MLRKSTSGEAGLVVGSGINSSLFVHRKVRHTEDVTEQIGVERHCVGQGKKTIEWRIAGHGSSQKFDPLKKPRSQKAHVVRARAANHVLFGTRIGMFTLQLDK
jgi:hypothetical protein